MLLTLDSIIASKDSYSFVRGECFLNFCSTPIMVTQSRAHCRASGRIRVLTLIIPLGIAKPLDYPVIISQLGQGLGDRVKGCSSTDAMSKIVIDMIKIYTY